MGSLYNSRGTSRHVYNAIMSRINSIGLDTEDIGADDAFFVVDMDQIAKQHLLWTTSLPQVQPFYAVKCNPDPNIIRALASLDCNFDCASVGEIQHILSFGIHPSRIIFANPCKSPSSLALARVSGVSTMTFDNEDELYKIKKHFPQARLVLRIYANDPTAAVCLSEKFGAPLNSVISLLEIASNLELDIVGVSFHIGTGASDPKAMETAINNAVITLKYAEQYGHHPHLLDIGGGFTEENFELMSTTVNQSIQSLPPGINVIAEPGRFLARSPYTLICKIFARRRTHGASEMPDMLYQNDGIYGNFMGNLTEKECRTAELICGSKEERGAGRHEYSIWGPTGDSMDVVKTSCWFEEEAIVGDWILYENMGGWCYTTPSVDYFSNGNSIFSCYRDDFQWLY